MANAPPAAVRKTTPGRSVSSGRPGEIGEPRADAAPTASASNPARPRPRLAAARCRRLRTTPSRSQPEQEHAENRGDSERERKDPARVERVAVGDGDAHGRPRRGRYSRSALREDSDVDAEAAGVDRLHPPVDVDRTSGGNRREIPSAIRGPVLGVDVDAAPEAEDVEVRDQVPRSDRTAIGDRRPKLELVPERRRDRGAVDLYRHGAGAWGSG